MNRSRKTADLASHGNIFVDIANDRVGIGTTQPTHKIDLDGSFKLHDGSGFDNHITYTQNPPTITFPSGPLANLSKTPTLVFGDRTSGGDLKIYQDFYSLHVRHLGPSGFHIGSQASHLVISGSNGSNAVQAAIRIDPGATEGVKLYSGGTQRFETVGYGVTVLGTTETQELNVTGITTAREGVIIPDNKALSLGNRVVGSTAGDLRIYHDGSNSYIDEIGSGNLFIRNGTDTAIFCQTDGAVKLYHDGTERLATTHNSVSITGNLNVSQSISYASNLNCNGDVNFNGDNSKTILFDKSDGTFEFADNARLRIGDGNHFQIFHDGTDTRFTNNSDHNIVKITSSEEVEIYKDQVKTVGITSFVDIPSPYNNQSMNHTGGRIRVRANVTDDPVIMSLGMFAAPPSGDANVGLCTVILQSNSAKRPELRFDNIHNGNWHESAGNTQHLRIIWTAPNENSTTPEVCELKPIVAGNASGTFSSFRIRTTDNSTGLKNVATLNTFGQTFYIDNSVTLQTSSNGTGIPESLHHYLDTDTRLRFPSNDTIQLETAGNVALRIDSSGRVRTDTGTQVSDFDITRSNSTITDVMLVKGNTGNGFIRFQDNDSSCNFTLGVDDGSGAGANSFILYDRVNSAYRIRVNNSGHVLPGADSTTDIGTNSVRWRNVYTDHISVAGISTAIRYDVNFVNAEIKLTTNQSSFSRYGRINHYHNNGSTEHNAIQFSPRNGSTGRMMFYNLIGSTVTERLRIDGTDGIQPSAHIIPMTDSTYNLGSNGTRFANVYADTLYGDGSNLTGITQTTINNNADNRVITGSGTANTLNAESKLTFDGTNLRVDQGNTSDGLVGQAYAGYFGLKHTDQSYGNEYMILSNDTHTYVSATNGYHVYIRSGNNDNTNQLIVATGATGLTWRGGTVWASGNDGSGSGLDADALDGQHGSYYRDAGNINAGTLNVARLPNHSASLLTSGTVAAARLGTSSTSEAGISVVGNFGQYEVHGTYTNFNTEPSFWGWNFVQGNTNAPNTSSSQWYRCRLSLGSNYGKGSDAGDYSLEMAIPRTSHSTAGGLHIRAIENGGEGSWHEVASKVGGNTVFHQGNDGSGSGLDADTLDGVQGGSFLRNDTDNNVSDHNNQVRFYSDVSIHTTSAYQASLEVYQSSAGNDAFMAFHVSGDFAAYLGLDGNINDFAVGGWSMGNNRYRIWHQGNDGSGSGLDADTLDGQQGSYYKDVPSGTVMVFRQNSAPTGWTKSTSHNNKAMRIVSGNVGSGGSNSFSTAFNSSRGTSGGSVSNHTLTTAQMPSHTHTGRTRNHDVNNSGSQGYPAGDAHNAHRTTDRPHNRNMATGTHQNTGSTNSHNHGFSNPSINLNVQYLDFIICTRS